VKLALLSDEETQILYGGEVPIVPGIENAGTTAYLKLTEGCSKPDPCAFCCSYRGARFRRRSLPEFKTHALDVASLHHEKGQTIRRVFLGEGDPLSPRVNDGSTAPHLVQEWLLGSIETARGAFPVSERPGESTYTYYLGRFMVTHIVPRAAPVDVASFVSTQDVLCRNLQHLREWRDAGLMCVYWGMESGSQGILEAIGKRAAADDLIRVGQRLAQAGIECTPIVLLGLLGEEGFEEHVTETVRVLRVIKPSYLSFSRLDAGRCTAPSRVAGRRPLDAARMDDQQAAIQDGLADLDIFYEDYTAHP
jgi:hypothetical protein